MVDYTGKVYNMVWKDSLQSVEQILIDSVSGDLPSLIKSSYTKTYGCLKESPFFEDLERANLDFSFAVIDVIPFLSYKNVSSFYSRTDTSFEGTWVNYLNSFQNGPISLSSLVTSGLNCSGQSLLIKQSIGYDNPWQMYNYVSVSGDVMEHGRLGCVFGSYFTVIDLPFRASGKKKPFTIPVSSINDKNILSKIYN